MNNEEKAKGHVVSCMITVVVVTALTVAAEMSASLKDGLKQVLFHHWVGKGVIALVVFVLFAHVIPLRVKKPLSKVVNRLTMLTVACGIVIFLFFLWEFFA